VNGHFELAAIPVGRQNLEVSYVGYYNKIIPNILLTSGKEVVLQIRLEEKAIEMEEVVVKAGRRKDQAINEMATVSARTFSVEETERFAGSLGDPARMVANYAGVMTQNDSRNDIIIRGNSPIGVLWRMEAVEIPNPNHFGALGTTGGPVSMVNNNLLANFRYSTLEVMDKLGFNFGTGEAIPQYKDLTFLVDLPGTRLGRFKVFGLWGDSFIKLGREASDTNSNSYSNRGMATDFGSGLAVIGMSHTYYFNEKTRIKSTLSYQQTYSTTVLDSVHQDLPEVPFLRSRQQENRWSFSTQFRQKIKARNNYSFGLVLDNTSIISENN
jgi:hypothetical protein